MRICYIGHKFHTRTKSNNFFTDVIKELGDVDEFYSSPDEDDSNDLDLILRLAQSDYDCYIFWQTEYLAEKLLPMKKGRFILIPMYDGAIGRPAKFWRQFVDCQFLSFSRVHHEQLQQLGCKTAYFQYFPKPLQRVRREFSGELKGFFWERRPGKHPTLQSVIELCRQLNVSALHVHAAPDFDESERPVQRPDKFTIGNLSITVSKWQENVADLGRILEDVDFYFAPRLVEGIGMSFLEAMARGQIVIAPEMPTMDEYIRDAVTGILYDPSAPHIGWAASPHKLRTISRNVDKSMERGYRQWCTDKDRLVSLVRNDGRRWITRDGSSHFRNSIAKRAHERVYNKI